MAGTFEEIPVADFRAQPETNFLGPLSVTRAVLPVSRAQRSGHVISVSSLAGLIGQAFRSAYTASKFAVEGWMESLAPEVDRSASHDRGRARPLPHRAARQGSTSYAAPSIDDYSETTRQTITAWSAISGQQGGEPARLARALVQIAALETPPARWVAGTDAVRAVEQKAADLLAQVDAHRDLSSDLAHDEPTAA